MKRNRLAGESSPYLLQHAGNPVDWYPWGPVALEKARSEDKPIFLSVGYSACHWCHVMERESFENEETARILNRDFVSIKVDREERPDIDSIYMSAVQAMTGRGGWPMSVFLTPDCAPFYGGSYFPDTPRYGMPSFNELLGRIATAWRDRRGEIRGIGERFLDSLRNAEEAGAGESGPLDASVLDAAVERLSSSFDLRHGGFGEAPKFPQPMAIEFLLRRHASTGDRLALEMATRTLDAMARGGIHDQLGGGFHRYSVDAGWLVPHFEKMLSDNALLARAYLHAWRTTGEERYARVASSTLDYVLREMREPAGGFHASQDADTEGEEGRFFTWTEKELREALSGSGPAGFGPAEIELFLDGYGVTPEGNFEGSNILFVRRDAAELAALRGLAREAVESALSRMRKALFEARMRRVRPGRDEKVLAAWNGLMLAAFAEGARLLARPDYLAAAEDNAGFLLSRMRAGSGRLLRSWKDGSARLNGYLEDHANVAHGLLELYRTASEPRLLDAARGIGEEILAHFADVRGGFFDTSDDHEKLIARPKTVQDGALPSGGSMAARTLLELSEYTGEDRFAEAARAAISRLQPAMAAVPLGFANWLTALAAALSSR